MKKTLAQFKRDIEIGDSMLVISYKNKFTDKRPEKFIVKLGFVNYKDTTGFYLKRIDDNRKKGSFLGWPKAKELHYENNIFTIENEIIKITYRILK